jgi:surface protein
MNKKTFLKNAIFTMVLFFTMTLSAKLKAEVINNPNFTVAANGVTCLCEDAAEGESGTLTINGVQKTFTKRTAAQLRALISADQSDLQIALTCTSGITDMSEMFQQASSFNQDIGSWDVSRVKIMQNMFFGAIAFNQDIGSWNVSRVRYMENMFSGGRRGSFTKFNQDIGAWDVSRVLRMTSMFWNAREFNQDIGAWNVSNVNNMDWMFLNAREFNQDLSNWCVTKFSNENKPFSFVSSRSSSLQSEFFPVWGTCPEPDTTPPTIINPNFKVAANGVTCLCEDAAEGESGTLTINGVQKTFTKRTETQLRALIISNQSDPQIALTCTSGITNMSAMFSNAITFNQDIGSWDVSSVIDMQRIFQTAEAFNGDIGAWDVSKVTNMQRMFQTARAFNGDIGAWVMSSVMSTSSMFSEASAFNQDLRKWDVSKVTDMAGMFNHARAFNQDIGDWAVSKVTDMTSMFNSARVFNQDIGAWNVSNVNNMNLIFYNAVEFNQDLSNWCVTKISNEPFVFARFSPLLSDFFPVWGTCPEPDTTPPTAIAQNVTVQLNEDGNGTITAAEVNNGSSSVSGNVDLSLNKTDFDCTNIGVENTVILTVTDASGNTDFTTANVTILEHFKETLDLRSLSSFEAFTGTGAVTNSGTFTGNVGTNVGALTGFSGSNFNGNIHLNDGLTAQAELDLLKVYIHLNNVFVTHPSANNAAHAPAFGSGETLYSGVYDIGGAGSLAGTLTLDGQDDPNAVFIMKFKGAFTAGAGSNIVLKNGADAANVFWVAQGALSVGANSAIKGTLLAYPGAITLGVNSSIEGRLLSSVGAITIGVGGTATMPAGTMNLPINPMVSYTPAAAVDVLGSIENFSLFTSNGAVANASTSGILGDVGANVGAISGFATSAHIGSFYNADAVTAQAKIDLNNAYSELMLIPTTVPNHTPAFGSGETLQAGVYSTPGAGSLAGTITLDGQNNPDAIFIFKFNGAFAAAAQSKVILSNGTRRCNVFWISEGAASIGAFSTLKGTILAHNGAATMGAGGNLEGRLLSTGGAIGFSTGVVYTVVHDVECDTSTAQKTTVKTAVDTEIISFEEELQVYPNPSKGIFNIKLSTVNVQTDIYLFDTTGKLIVRKSISKENNSRDLIRIGNNNLSSGIYLVKIITNNKAVTKKVIVEKR